MKSPLSLGEKIKHIRKAKGLSLENLAYAARCSATTIHRIESDQQECNAETLAAIKKFMDIENAPLLEHELELFKTRLFLWDDLLNARRIADARIMKSELLPIVDLPFEQELFLLYSIIETRLMLYESNVDAAEEKFNALEALVSTASDEVRYIFHINKGAVYTFRADHQNAMTHYLKALELKGSARNKDIRLLVNLGVTHFGMGKPYNCIKLHERARREYGGDLNNPALRTIPANLAACYALVGEHNKAMEMFSIALTQAKLVNDKYLIGNLLSNISLLNIKMGDYQESINNCDEALAILQEGTFAYIVTLYQKGLALLKLKKLDECQKIVELGLSFQEVGGDEFACVNFNTLAHLMTINNNESANYIQNIAIPYFRNMGVFKFRALDLCKELEQHYTKKRAPSKALSVAVIMRDIYEEIAFKE